MKISLITLFSLSTVCTFLAAQDTIYIDKEYKWVTDKSQAIEYGVITKEGKSTAVAFHNLNGRLKGIGHYSKYTANPAKRIRNGKSSFLYQNGKDSLIANYAKNKRNGEQTVYYPSGKIKTIFNYDMGHIKSLIQYYENGQLRRKETFDKKNNSIGGSFYNEAGEIQDFVPYFVMPQFPGGGDAFLKKMKKYLRYPIESEINGKEGRIWIEFVVEKDGNITDPVITKSPFNDKQLSKAAIKALKALSLIHKFIPGTADGEPMRSRMSMPVNFRLH